jgi:F5/8 type C domain
MKALAALAGAAFTVAACYALGAMLVARLGARLRRDEKFPLAFVLGAAVLHLAIFAVMALKMVYKPVLIALLSGCVAAALATGDWRLPAADDGERNRLPPAIRYLFGIIAAAFTVLYLFNAWAPEISPDGSSYHLTLVAHYLRAHGFTPVLTNVYSTLSGGVDVLFVPAFAIGRHSAAALTHFAFLIALALAVWSYGRRIGQPLAGGAGALLVYLSPVVGIDGTSAYIDVAVAAIVFSVFYWVQIWDSQREGRILIAIGLLAGYCYAAKYTAFVMLFYAVGFVAWRTRRMGPAMVVAVCSLAMAAPWIVKDWIYIGNPVAPFANSYFQNPNIHVSFERFWTANLRTYGLKNLWTLPLEVTVHGETTGGLLGPVFLAAPLALLALRSRSGRRLLVPCALILATYFGNVGTRFLIPSLPFVALAMALALEPAAPLLILLVTIHAGTSWPASLRHYTQAWALQGIPFKAALRIIPEDRYLNDHFDYRWARLIEDRVPPGARVLVRSDVATAYTSRDVFLGYEGAFNEEMQDLLDVGWDSSLQPRKLWTCSFPERRLRRLRVVQTGTAKIPEEQWDVHELRFFHAGVELPRLPEWRLQAHPNPWGVQMAFDNSEATRWRSWETLHPDMYIQVDFGREQPVDQVRVELSDIDWNVRMRVETMDANGMWTPLPAREELRPEQYEGSVRRAAGFELRARGVDYLLLKDTDWGAKDIAENPARWGMTRLAYDSGASLYEVNPAGANP